jgi:hypothetical protein
MMTTETDYGQVDPRLRDEEAMNPSEKPVNEGGGGGGELPGEIQQTPKPAVVPPDGDD